MNTLTRALCLLVLGAAACSGSHAPDLETTGVLSAAVSSVPVDGNNVAPSMELVITDTSVVESSLNTMDLCGGGASNSAWSFRGLITQIANANGVNGDEAVANMVEDMFYQWTSDQTMNVPFAGTEVMPNRKTMMNQFIINSAPSSGHPNPWPRTTGGYLDLDMSPFRLLAIVNRMDLRTSDGLSQAGQGRFVFGAVYNNGTTCVPLPFTMIFEYNLPLTGQYKTVRGWANAWHQLGLQNASTGFTPAYVSQLLALTNQFTQSTNLLLGAIRTDEVAMAPVQGPPVIASGATPAGVAPTGTWEMREIHATKSCPTSFTEGVIPPGCLIFQQTTNNADHALLSAANQGTLTTLMNDYTCTSSATTEVASYQGAYAPNLPALWNAPSVTNPANRHDFALNFTCAGCHSFETGTTGFMHIMPRNLHTTSQLSNFLTGCTQTTLAQADCLTTNYIVNDPINTAGGLPITYPFNEIERRSLNLITLERGGTTYANCLQ